MGADPRRFVVPPLKTFMMNALTEEERAEFLARFPQLRIYPFVERGTYRFAHFTSHAFGRIKAYLNASCIKDVGAWSRYVRTARLWDRGVETNLTIRAVSSEGLGPFSAAVYDEVVLGGNLVRPDMLAVAEHRYPVAVLEDLDHAVGNVDDGDALGRQLPHDREQQLRLALRQRGGGLVKDQDAAVEGERLGDLDQLLVGDREIAHQDAGVDIGKLGEDAARLGP